MAIPQTSLPSHGKDPYRGHSPRAVVVVGGQVVICESFDVNINDKAEVNTATIRIPLENIDSSVFANRKPSDGVFSVQIWAGYMEDRKNPYEQLNEITQAIAAKQEQKYLSKRFEGYVIQPEWTYGSANYLTLSCADWTNILREARYLGQPLKDSGCEVKNVLKAVQGLTKGIKITLQGNPPNTKLGQLQSKPKSDKKQEQVYNPQGKNLFEIIQEVARAIEYRIYVNGTEIILMPPIKKPIIWEMYYGSKEMQKVRDVAVGQYFNELNFRYGAKGRSGKSNVAVCIKHTIKQDKGPGKKGQEWYPDESNFAGADETYIIYETLPGYATKQQAKNYAKMKYNEKLKSTVTGNLTLEFANNFVEVGHAVTIKNDGSQKNVDLSFLNGIWFSICSVSESYNNSGYKQTIEFESDYAFEQVDDKGPKQVAPPKKDK